MRNPLTEFIQYELYPALYERLDSAFPELQLKRSSGDWHSPNKLNGEPSSPFREDKTVVTMRKPHLLHEQGGDTLSLVDYQLTRMGYQPGAKGAELVEAVRSLASVCSLEVPNSDTEEYKAYKERQERMEQLARKMRKELFTESGADVLFYLQEVRGYTVEEVKAMELGYCSPDTASQLEGAPYGAGTKYTLAIPYRSGNSILGFKLRTVEDGVQPKYKNTSGLPKKASLFGLTGLKLSGSKEKDRDLTVVEGELDALRAQIKGAKNIVASAGLDISIEALQEAKKRGVKRVTLLVDMEETDERQKAKETLINKAIHTVHEAGLTSLVAILPAGKYGEKVDVDSFLSSHTVEELQEVIDGASTGAKYLYYRIFDKAVEAQGGGDRIEDKYYNQYKEDTIALVNDVEVVSPVDRDIILTLFAKSTSGAGITKEALQEEADRRKAVADAQRQEKKAKELLEKASQLANEGRIEESLTLLANEAENVKKIAKETELASLLAIPTASNIRERLAIRPEGIKTDYYFSTGNATEQLTLPVGGLTLVGAPTSHGKSTFLRNLAIQVARDTSKEESILYFSLEEDYESTYVRLLNTYANIELTSRGKVYNNISTIEEYYRSGSTKYMKHGTEAIFKDRESTFMKDYIESGRLRIYDRDFFADELVDAIQYFARKMKVKAVFVDYVQLLYKQGNKLQRNEELKLIAKSLRQLAKGEKLPIILACQLNREAKSPTDMYSQNIADSADLEREANKCILLWNSSFQPLKKEAYDSRQIEKEKQPSLGTYGEIYARLSKNRGGIVNLDALFQYNGNTGVISQDVGDLPEGGDFPGYKEETRELF
mgnify:CR=1 FL=1